MGTRHLIAVQVDGEYKVAQYGQWDGYPSSQGVSILAFLRNADLAKFSAKVRATRFLTEAELKAITGADWKRRFPHLSRDAGSAILHMVMNADDGIALKNDIDFAADSLFCEYAYVIDLDTKKLEVFRGFNTTGQEKGGRFSNLPFEQKHRGENQYYPVTKLCEFDLANLPSDADFLKVAEPEDEEEEEEA